MALKSKLLVSAVLVLVTLQVRAELAPAEDPAIIALRTKLEKTTSLRVSDVAVHRALGILAKSADVPLHIVGKTEGDAFELPLNINVQNARAIDILEAIREISHIPFEIKPSGVSFHLGATLTESVTMRVYSVVDLTITPPDMGMDVVPAAVEAAGAPFAAAHSGPTITNIADMIRNRVRPESWDPALGTSIEERSNVLVVMQREEVHAEIRQLLAEFRAKNRRQVGIELRALALKSTDIDRLRREITKRGGEWPVLDAPALEALDKLLQEGAASGIFEGSSIVFNGQRGRMENAEHRQMLVDYEISGDAYDPVVRRVTTGWTSTFQPVLSDDGKRVSLNLKLSQMELLGNPELFTIQRGSMIQPPGPPSNITIKQKRAPASSSAAQPVMEQPAAPEAKPVAKDPAAPAVPAPAAPGAVAAPGGPQPPPLPLPQEPRPPAAVAATPVSEDVTHEFEIHSTGQPGAAVPGAGPLQLQLPALGVTRVKQDLVLPAGKSVAVCMPLHGKDGIELGRELLAIVRCSPLQAALPKTVAADGGVADLQALSQKLQKPITVALGEIPLPHAIQALSIHTGIAVMLDHPALDQVLQESVVMNFENARGEEILNTILQSAHCAVIRYPSLLLFTAVGKAGARGQMLRIFDIHDLTLAPTDYPVESGYENQVSATQGIFCQFPGGAYDGVLNTAMNAADVQQIVKEKLFPADFADPATSIEEQASQLIVMNTPPVLAKIEKALNDLNKLRRRFGITARFAVVNSADLRAALGAELPHTLNAAQAEKLVDLIGQPLSRDLSTARLSAYQGQRVSAFSGIARSVVVDYDVSGAALDPVVGNYFTGVKCEVQPVVMENAGGELGKDDIMLTTVLSLSKGDVNPTTVDPLAPGARIMATYPAQPGKLHAAKSQSQEVRNTVHISDGGAALFRLPVPAWLAGEDPEAVKRGQRMMIVVLQAQVVK